MPQYTRNPTKWRCNRCQQVNDYATTSRRLGYGSLAEVTCPGCGYMQSYYSATIVPCGRCEQPLYQLGSSDHGQMYVGECLNCGHPNYWKNCPDHGHFNAADERREKYQRTKCPVCGWEQQGANIGNPHGSSY